MARSISTGSKPQTASPVEVSSEPQLQNRSRLWRLMGVQVMGTGSAIGNECVRNEDLAEHGYDADWIVKRTGIRQRYKASPEQATSDLAYQAAQACLERANVDVGEIDLIIVATMTPDHPTPSTACLVQRMLGATAAAMDVNAACSGFMYALVTGMQYVKAGCSKRALIIGADIMSRIVNPADKKTFPLFGDAAGAVIVGAGGPDQGLLSFTLGSEGAGGDLLCSPGGGSREPFSEDVLNQNRYFLQMNGRTVFKWAVRLCSESVLDVLKHAGLTAEDLDLAVLHQANMRILDAAINDLGIDRDKVFINVDRYGNTSAGSIPLALDEGVRAGRVHPGDKVLLCGFGAGLAWGTAALTW